MATLRDQLIAQYGGVPENFKGNPALDMPTSTPMASSSAPLSTKARFGFDIPTNTLAPKQTAGMSTGTGSSIQESGGGFAGTGTPWWESLPGFSDNTGSSSMGSGGSSSRSSSSSVSGDRTPFFTPNSKTPPGGIDYDLLAQRLGIRGGSTGIAEASIRAQQSDLERMKKYEDEKFNLINQGKSIAMMSPEARQQYLTEAQNRIRGAQAARGIFTSGAAVKEEADLMPQIIQQLNNWQLQAINTISSQLDPLIRSTAGRAAMYQGGLP